ncbi:apolipoprotein N-acyltransferase [Kiritimatiella glycovorans]|uniref:Apolipoprotein N-acyltransferase n=1 Tax=Kiritimatiella glycovorans TaxID=1307763 RepID=A0A0G3EBC4_9BACT|nr:apolipoprotein N-acyltransferase [Kiritimatiella glycovorans]AKJ63593.1 Apolipoprotein N-acyltransferase [Kiritimatiella glycovorans]
MSGRRVAPAGFGRCLCFWGGAVGSGVLLAAAFPPFALPAAAWVALVPLWLVCARETPARILWAGWISALVFFLISLSWLNRVTVPGTIILSAVCALYTLPFTAVLALFYRVRPRPSAAANLAVMALGAAAWAGAEYARGVMFTGFPWNALGVSQYAQVPLIQIAAWGGVPALSALAVWVNGGVAATVLHYARNGARRTRPHVELAAGFLLMAAAFGFGWRGVMRASPSGDPVRVALVQPAIPQVREWTAPHVETIYRRLKSLSVAALRGAEPDLLIWPETALPDFARRSPRSRSFISEITTNGVPLLAGSMDLEWKGGRPVYYNSSILFDRTGAERAKYDKKHLVVFGEYVPLEKYLPFLRALSPNESDFSPGSKTVVFRGAGEVPPFSVLICFEDVFPDLSRAAVRAGARWLVNQTNDGWFEGTAASRQHLAHSVFRAVETRVPLVRCSNTGVTGAIDRFGRIHALLRSPEGEEDRPGFLTTAVLPVTDPPSTLYLEHGPWFGKSCAALAAVVLILLYIPYRRATA